MAELALKGLAIASKLIESRIREQVLFDLKESDIIGQHFRDLFIKELESVKEKLDGLARVDLLASLNFYKDGITLLHGHVHNINSTGEISKEPSQNKDTPTLAYRFLDVLGLTSTHAVKETDETDNAFIVEAKNKFDKAIECAVKAVSNDTLKLQDRILASRLRIIATILKHIDENEISLTLCKSYVQQINSIPEGLNNIKVHFGKGLRKKLYSDERKELVWSIISINRLLWNYAHSCKAGTSYFIDWPILDLGEDGELHPILDGAVREEYSWFLNDTFCCPQGVALANNGRFVVADTLNYCVKVFSASGQMILSCKVPDFFTPSGQILSGKEADHQFTPRCISVSDNFDIFAGSSRGRREDPPFEARIYVFYDNGQYVKLFGEDIFTSDSVLTSMVIDSHKSVLYVTDDNLCNVQLFNLEGEFLKTLCQWEPHEGYSHISLHEEGQILLTHWDCVQIYDSDGQIISSIKIDYGNPLGGIGYDQTRQQLYVLCKAYKHIDKNAKPNLQVFDKELNPQGMIELPKSYRSSKGLAVTPTGFVAVVNVDDNEVIVI